MLKEGPKLLDVLQIEKLSSVLSRKISFLSNKPKNISSLCLKLDERRNLQTAFKN